MDPLRHPTSDSSPVCECGHEVFPWHLAGPCQHQPCDCMGYTPPPPPLPLIGLDEVDPMVHHIIHHLVEIEERHGRSPVAVVLNPYDHDRIGRPSGFGPDNGVRCDVSERVPRGGMMSILEDKPLRLTAPEVERELEVLRKNIRAECELEGRSPDFIELNPAFWEAIGKPTHVLGVQCKRSPSVTPGEAHACFEERALQS